MPRCMACARQQLLASSKSHLQLCIRKIYEFYGEVVRFEIEAW